jgi:hypothetical protein
MSTPSIFVLVGGELTVSACDKALDTHLTGVWTDTRAWGDMMGEKNLSALALNWIQIIIFSSHSLYWACCLIIISCSLYTLKYNLTIIKQYTPKNSPALHIVASFKPPNFHFNCLLLLLLLLSDSSTLKLNCERNGRNSLEIIQLSTNNKLMQKTSSGFSRLVIDMRIKFRTNNVGNLHIQKLLMYDNVLCITIS